MTRLLETPVFSTQNSLPQEAKFVDELTQGKSFQALALAAAPRLGSGHFRKDYLDEFANGGSVGANSARSIAEWELHRDAEWGCLSPEERLQAELAELDAEENAKALFDYLPDVWKPFLEGMKQPRRGEREDAIWNKVGRDGLRILQHGAVELGDYASMKARAYAREFPARDEAGKPINQQEKHQNGAARNGICDV